MNTFTLRDFKNKIWPLIRFAHETVPLLVLEQIIPLELMIDKFPLVMDKYLACEGDTGFTANDFSLTKHTVVYKNSEPYYILVFHYPFEHNILCVRIVKRMFIVVSEELKGIHCFNEVLAKQVSENGNELYYDLQYIAREDNGLVSYSACERPIFDNEEWLAQECAFWAKLIETKGIVGEKGLLKRKLKHSK